MAIERSDRGNGVSVITLDGKEEGNYLYTDDIQHLAATLTDCGHDQVRAIIVTGKPRNFCSGRVGRKGLTKASDIAEDLGVILQVNTALNALSAPVIAAVEGNAFGFAFGFTAQADYAVVSKDAVFALPEMSHGIPPLVVFSYLFRFVNYKKAFELALTSRPVPAEDAEKAGIVTEIVPAGTTLARAIEVADQMAALDPKTLGLFRRFARRMADVHAPAIAEDAVALMSVVMADRAVSH
ncbi:MAG TPA: enoyl-CoA hydratase/isomerase family protein [Stellaceae bacterium]|jgi:enoyl-CoA hydratase/carnithine racemase|nr:enoyl-CoA hydratase/isomerase family protein [Stellaceae bacterium]